jgi:2-dehydro-3-deoxyphosphogluconate aldolase / (4S)-4-hydroxy-2-oxoglutarate aldolase
MTLTVEQVMTAAPVVPVMVIDDLKHAVPLARALTQGGLKALEITLRTPVALDAIKAIKEAMPEAMVGAGTIVCPQDLEAALEAGASFLVSPGATPLLADVAATCGVPMLPGVATPSEAMQLLEKGFTHLKFFPAEAAGGVAMLKSIGGPLPQITFCPTGGINLSNAREYLALTNVACIGGSWMAPRDLVEAQAWDEIEALARGAAALKA